MSKGSTFITGNVLTPRGVAYVRSYAAGVNLDPRICVMAALGKAPSSALESLVKNEFVEMVKAKLTFEQHDLFPGFEIVRELGRGAMGVVYEVKDVKLGRTCALKTVLVNDETTLNLFQREMTLHAALEHQNIVAIHHGGSYVNPQNGQELPFYIMKIVPGMTLENTIKQDEADFDLRERVLTLAKVADAIAYAHNVNLTEPSEAIRANKTRGIIHRDLKPENITIGPDGLFVMDFGLAKMINDCSEVHQPAPEGTEDFVIDLNEDDGPVGLSIPGEIKGTPMYMSPEQTNGEATSKSDVYALGEILYEAISRRRFHEGDWASSRQLLMAIAEGFGGTEEGYKVIPRELVSVIKAATAYAPDDRPTAAKFRDNLYAYLDGKKVSLHTYSRKERIVRFVKKHSTKLVGAAAAAAISFAALTGYANMQRHASNLETTAARAKAAEAEAAQKKLEAEKERDAAALKAAEAERKAINTRQSVLEEQLKKAMESADWDNSRLYLAGLRALPSAEQQQERLSQLERRIQGYTLLTINAPDDVDYALLRVIPTGLERLENLRGDHGEEVTPGHYFVEARPEGFAVYRNHVEVKRGEPASIAIEKVPEIEGFTFIPGGKSCEGMGADEKPVEVKPFYIQTRHITIDEYFNGFLKSKGIGPADVDPKLTPVNMRSGRQTQSWPLQSLLSNGFTLNQPCPWLSPYCVEKYAKWYSAKKEVEARLASEAEMRRALGEKMGHNYPGGNTLNFASANVIPLEKRNGMPFSEQTRIETYNSRRSLLGVILGDMSDICIPSSRVKPLAVGGSCRDENPLQHSIIHPFLRGMPFDLGSSSIGARLVIPYKK